MRVFFLALGFFLVTFAKVSTINCERSLATEDSCKIVKHGFLWREEQLIPINNLKGARMIVSGSDFDSHTYQVVIVTNKENILFSPNTTFRDKKQQQEAASRINNFARSSNKDSLNISLDDRWWIIVGVISLTIGMYPHFVKKEA
ncbi:MAG: hypothetical protein IGS39_06745 [Calothrix sp. C42_A2020_038]|nr:hypothetical protein [Calothrix sp. C42_A2020_038]